MNVHGSRHSWIAGQRVALGAAAFPVAAVAWAGSC